MAAHATPVHPPSPDSGWHGQVASAPAHTLHAEPAHCPVQAPCPLVRALRAAVPACTSCCLGNVAGPRADIPRAVPARDTTKGRFRHESAPCKRRQAPGRALRARLYLVREPAPHSRAEPQHRPGTVLRVTHEDHARSVTDFDAVTAAVACVTGRPPAWLYVVFHCSAAFKMRSRDASRDSASPRTRLNATRCLRTSDRFSVV